MISIAKRTSTTISIALLCVSMSLILYIFAGCWALGELMSSCSSTENVVPVGIGREIRKPDQVSGVFVMPKPDPNVQRSQTKRPCLEKGGICQIPANYLGAYIAAGKRWGIPWELLAAVGFAESSHGETTVAGVHSGANEAGAKGPMQFLDGTWKEFGEDGDGDGVKNVYDIEDAAFGAARYLRASGAARGEAGVKDAIYAYNRSWAYVKDVLTYAWDYHDGRITAGPSKHGSGQCSPGTGTATEACAADFQRQAKGEGLEGWAPMRNTPNGPQKLVPEGQDPKTHLTPRTQAVKTDIERWFKGHYVSIGGWRPGPDAYSDDHGCGRALDIMVTKLGSSADAKETANGYAIANWAMKYADQYGVHYIIFRQCIWNVNRKTETSCGNVPAGTSPTGWRGMGNRGSNTQNHYDHVHISMW